MTDGEPTRFDSTGPSTPVASRSGAGGAGALLALPPYVQRPPVEAMSAAYARLIAVGLLPTVAGQLCVVCRMVLGMPPTPSVGVAAAFWSMRCGIRLSAGRVVPSSITLTIVVRLTAAGNQTHYWIRGV